VVAVVTVLIRGSYRCGEFAWSLAVTIVVMTKQPLQNLCNLRECIVPQNFQRLPFLYYSFVRVMLSAKVSTKGTLSNISTAPNNYNIDKI